MWITIKKSHLFEAITATVVGLFCVAGLAFGQIQPFGPSSPQQLLDGIAGKVAEVVGSIGTIMVIVAGILYVTSGGSPERIGTAKKTLAYAIVGMAIGLAASAITAFVGGLVK